MYILQFTYGYTSEIRKIHNGQKVSFASWTLNTHWSKVYVHCDISIYKSVGKIILYYIKSQRMVHSELIQSNKRSNQIAIIS